MIERIAAARPGDEQALEEVIIHYQDRIAGYVVALVGKHSADLDDLCQTVFLKMALSLPALKALDAFEPCLFRIARNVCRDHLRRRRFRHLFIPLTRDHEAIAFPAEQNLEETEAMSNALEGALTQLSGAQQELIDLLCRREYSYQELARLTKTSGRSLDACSAHASVCASYCVIMESANDDGGRSARGLVPISPVA